MRLKCVENYFTFISDIQELTAGKIYHSGGALGSNFVVYNDQGEWRSYSYHLFVPEDSEDIDKGIKNKYRLRFPGK